MFFWHNRTTSEEIHEHAHHHDHALVLSITETSRAPRLRQLRFLNHVLSPREKQLFWGSTIIFILALGSGLASLALPHIKPVPASGGTIHEGLLGGPKLINPLYLSTNDVDRDLSSLIYAGLFRLTDTLEAQPDLVERYRWLDNNTTLEITLRTDARFHNNSPVTSDDVIFTYQAVQDPTWRSPLYATYKGINIVRIDDITVQFQLGKAIPLFLSDLTLGILPAHLWQDIPGGNAVLADLNLRPVGAGPYRASALTRDSKGTILSYTLEKFDQYHGLQPHIQEWRFRFFPDHGLAVQALKNSRIDSLAFLSWKEAAAVNAPHVQRSTIQLPQESVVFFNTKQALLKDEKLRSILARSIDRAEVSDLLKEHASIIDSPLPFLAATSSTPPLSIEEARTALTKLGWVIPSDGDVRVLQPAKPSTKTPPPLLTTSSTALVITIDVPDQPDLVSIADYLRGRWSLLGIRVDIRTKPPEQLLKEALANRTEYSVLIWNILLSPSQDLSAFWRSTQAAGSGLNLSNTTDKEIDTALDSVRNATTTEAVFEARQRVITAINARTPAVFLARPVYTYLVNTRIHGVTDMQIARPSDRLLHAGNWYIDSNWIWN